MAKEAGDHSKKDKSAKKRKSLTADEAPASTPKKDKKVAEDDLVMEDVSPSKAGETDPYDARLSAVLPFAQPLADKKLNKKVLKTVKKAAKAKHVKRGVKEVVKALRKGDKGLVVLAGDISPPDVISHIPVLCEDSGVPFVFVPAKESLGSAGATKRPTSCVMVIPGGFKKKAGDKADKATEEYKESYDEVVGDIKKL
ncbi:Nhp2 H/ACA snoRNP protein [Dipodascopsis tothii]|uniref:Nhp2 H/ACA snoRNP protein n=1 Tax=Dipodascopsis tothii TaxID=44089 RepID=UPI0034CF2EBB